MIRFKLNQQ
ncbi:unnamed protein product [Lasius platythorax]|uniref:Uncharacterized protein n=1 Tax=Lasius platythorax TaxID=488582 RepID=A0AAV2NZJ6_9HYME